MTAREKIANLLWRRVPSTDAADAKAKTEQMLDEHRIENRVEAADWFAGYPFPAASTDWERGRDAGVAWAASVLRIPHPQRSDVAAPVNPSAVPLVVSRFDTAMEPAPEEEQVLTIGCIAEDGRPVALRLDVDDRRKVAGWLPPTVTEWGVRLPGSGQYVAAKPTEQAAREDAADASKDGVEAVVVSRTAYYGEWTEASS